MKVLVAVIDSASFDMASRSFPDLQREGFEVEWLVYNHAAPLRERMLSFADAHGIPVYDPALLEPVSAADWLALWKADPMRSGWPGVWASLVFFSLLRLKQRLIKTRRLGPRKWRNLDQVAALTFGFLRDRDTLKRLLADVKPDAVVLHHDFVGHMTTNLANQARRKRIPVVLRPALVPAPDRLAKLLVRRPANRPTSRIAKWVARAYPRWVTDADGERVMRLPWAHIVALNMSGLTTRRPWLHQSVPVDAISLPQEALVPVYAGLGFARSKITVNPHRDEAVPPPALAGDERALVIAAIPPNQFLAGTAPGRFSSYEELLDAFFAHLDSLSARFNLKLAPHPKDQLNYIPLPLRDRYPLCAGPTQQCLVAAHALFTYAGSATVQWRDELGRAVMVWDPFGYGGEGGIPQTHGPEASCDIMQQEIERCLLHWGGQQGLVGPLTFPEFLGRRLRKHH